MKLPMTLFAACFVASLFDVGLAASQTVRPSQTASAARQQTMEECKARYGRGLARCHLARDRYAYIDACFKELTGKYPFQADVNCLYHCLYRRKARDFYC